MLGGPGILWSGVPRPSENNLAPIAALANNGTNDRRTKMPTFEELVPKHRGNYADTAVYFMAEIGSDEPIIVTYNTNYEDADDIVGR